MATLPPAYSESLPQSSALASVKDKIRQASAKNTELLRVLTETDHAKPSLDQQRRLIADLEREVAESDKRLAAVGRKRQKEFKDHEKYRDSVLRRFAYKATGKSDKFSAKAAKEETEYFEALQEEQRETAISRDVKDQLSAARNVAENLEAQVRRHNEMQTELDNLYSSIFAGTTPGFPAEDEKEQICNAAMQAYHEARTALEAESHAVRILREAQQRMGHSLSAIEEALSHSRRDMFGGGSFTDMMERNALHRAEAEAMAAQMLVLQAKRMSPHVGDLPDVSINQGNLMMDVFFDNIFTDMAFHEEIKRSKQSVVRAASVMDGLLADAAKREAEVRTSLQTKEREMQEARVALQRERERAFESVMGGSV
ncbi:hypothetical protein QBC42DRAFT_262193 [Cladorrhinum samala]|uniref:Uncharacterized protein n=1 Tax=Cladorrhinum samala TaxID=585594 RepID=A0AAV9HYK9_9PEZI|nr:hypothetical protein QBC42DRAFT_262193 [Cladorrhinum samala]